MKYRFPGVLAVAAAVNIALLSGGCASSNGAAAPPVEQHNVIVGAVPVAAPERELTTDVDALLARGGYIG